ncbi:Alpha-(1,3)-fucosyltransferase 10 [Tupaia chinensis]|uniref:Fucosyltransferase n=1 Tax=Tupaia chinensis TaxID=246437 RepID=L9L1T4_TUPCH|nr:Alpha-(1,3)-fucosyltransferase 10 [Tupaia chinensis]
MRVRIPGANPSSSGGGWHAISAAHFCSLLKGRPTPTRAALHAEQTSELPGSAGRGGPAPSLYSGLLCSGSSVFSRSLLGPVPTRSRPARTHGAASFHVVIATVPELSCARVSASVIVALCRLHLRSHCNSMCGCMCLDVKGTDFSINSLPLPRKAHHDWALFHEESPKNNYKLFHEPVITLFNHTATFSRHSHLPLTTQYLEGVHVLRSLRYLVPLQAKNHLRRTLAPLVYVQSDCDPPSDRDSYVRELMTYIEVDSYGACLRNRELPLQLQNPASMDADGFYRIIAQYKFILAFENAVCDDYITEKLWRPLKLGVVPVYYGSPSVADWLPSNRSVILVSEFPHPRELARYIRRLDQDDRLYEAYVEWKWKGEISNQRLLMALRERRWGVQDATQDSHIDAFECLVCRKVWGNIRLQEQGLPPRRWKAEAAHLRCPEPSVFAFSPAAAPRSSWRELWVPSFQQSKREAQALRWLVDRNQNFSAREFWALVFKD